MIAMVNFFAFAKDIMIRDVYVIEVGNKIALARLKMMRHGIGGLPVVDKKGKVVGMITLRDIDLAGTDVSNLPVEDLMTTNLVKGKVDTTTKEIVELMIKTGIQRIPIVDEKGKLLGLITQTSIIKSAIAHNLLK
jgi:CBS domain-containing protein